MSTVFLSIQFLFIPCKAFRLTSSLNNSLCREITFRFDSSLTATSRCCNSLTIMRISHISRCEYSGNFRTGAVTICNNVTHFVSIDILLEDIRIRFVTDSQEEAVDRQAVTNASRHSYLLRRCRQTSRLHCVQKELQSSHASAHAPA